MSPDPVSGDAFRPESGAGEDGSTTRAGSSALVARLRAAGCVFAEEEARLLLDAAGGDVLEARVRRRVAGEPLETILGWAELMGHRLVVAPGVFVPRQRTALLVRLALDATAPGCVLVELCAGVAPVASIVASRSGSHIEVHASEIDPVAAECARTNLPPTAGLHVGDLFDALPEALRGRIDVLVANAPYVPSADIASMPREARDHEPRTTLDGGVDGLDLHRRIAAAAPDWLAPGGVLMIETSRRQAPATSALTAAAGLQPRIEHDDDLDATVVVASRPGTRPEPHER